MRSPRMLWWCLAVALATVACTTAAPPPTATSAPSGYSALRASGDALDVTGRQFVAVGGIMNMLFDANVIGEPQYAPWRAFAWRYKTSYPAAVAAWEAARAACDTGASTCASTTANAQALTAPLASELATLAATAYQLLATPAPAPAKKPAAPAKPTKKRTTT